MKQQRQTLQGFAGIANLYRSVITDCRRAMRTTILVLIMLFNNSYAQDSTPQTTKRIEMKTQFFFMNNTISGIFGLLENPVKESVPSGSGIYADVVNYNDSLGDQIIFTFIENVRYIDDYRTKKQIALSDSGVRVLFMNKQTGEFSYDEKLGYARGMNFDGFERKLFFVKNDRELYFYDLKTGEVRLVVALDFKIIDYYPIQHGRVVVRSGGETIGLNGFSIARLTMFDYLNDTFVPITNREDVGYSLKVGKYGESEKIFFMTDRTNGFETVGTYDLQTGKTKTLVTSIRFGTTAVSVSDSVLLINRLTSSKHYSGHLNLNSFEYKDLFREISFSRYEHLSGSWYVKGGWQLNKPYDEDTVSIMNNRLVSKVKPKDSVMYLINIETLESKDLGIFVSGDDWSRFKGSVLNNVNMVFPETGHYVSGGGASFQTNRFFGPEMPMKTVSYKEANVKVYPNPTSGTVSISSPDPIKMVEVYDQTGRLVYKGQKTSLDLPKGINTVVVYTTNGISTQKVVSF